MRPLLVICALAVPAFADTAPDADKPYEHFVKQCKAKVIMACTEQGQRLMDGNGVAKDEKAGFALWERSCKAKDGRACNNLGTSWSDGNQGASAVDHVKAKALYDKACTL
nr:sel1 repeat family protein [Deltaproteobacteria bacterium]